MQNIIIHKDNRNKKIANFSGTSLQLKKKRAMPVVGYIAEDICDYYDRRPLVVGWRLNKLGFPLLGKFCSGVLTA
jgi:hypothetical protein